MIGPLPDSVAALRSRAKSKIDGRGLGTSVMADAALIVDLIERAWPSPTLSEEQLSVVRTMAAGGVSAIAVRLRRSRNWVRRVAQDHAIDVTIHPRHHPDRAMAIDLYRQGQSSGRIGMALGVSSMTVYRWARDAGVPVHPVGRPGKDHG